MPKTSTKCNELNIKYWQASRKADDSAVSAVQSLHPRAALQTLPLGRRIKPIGVLSREQWDKLLQKRGK